MAVEATTRLVEFESDLWLAGGGVDLLYDRNKLFDMVESLVGLAMRENRRVTTGHPSDPPIVVVVGGRGMGKTAALAEISRAYGNRAPRALVDLADQRYSEDYGDGPSGNSPLLRILQDLKWGLEMKVRHNGRLRFPRLSLALLAIATWQPGTEITLDEANKRLADAGDSVAAIARISPAERGDWANDWVSDVAAELAAQALPFPVNVFVKASVHAFTAKALKVSSRKASFAWHQDYDPGLPGDGYEALISLSRDFHLGGDFRARAEDTLVAAFLADVSAGYRGVAAVARSAFPLALLDNAGACPAGVRLLELVLGQRARPAADPLVIVTAGPEELVARLTGLVEPDQPMRPGPLLARAELTRLSQGVTLRMLNKADAQQLPPDLAHLIHRLAAGLPLGLEILASAVTSAAPAAGRRTVTRPVDSAAILALPVAPTERDGAGSVASHLVERLLPDPEWRSRLVTLAAARDFPAAQALVTAHLATDQNRLTAAKAAQLLRANGWDRDPAHFVGDPFLRTLLLNQLACRTTSPTSAGVHATLRDLYTDGETGLLARTEPARLYHRLALGDSAGVVRRFDDSFEGSDADVWLGALQLVACAPHGGHPDTRRDIAVGAADSASHDEVYRSVNRLLHAAWFLTDPLVIPDRAVAKKITEELNLLAAKHPTGNEVLARAGVSWPARLMAWQQADYQSTQGE